MHNSRQRTCRSPLRRCSLGPRRSKALYTRNGQDLSAGAGLSAIRFACAPHGDSMHAVCRSRAVPVTRAHPPGPTSHAWRTATKYQLGAHRSAMRSGRCLLFRLLIQRGAQRSDEIPIGYTMLRDSSPGRSYFPRRCSQCIMWPRGRISNQGSVCKRRNSFYDTSPQSRAIDPSQPRCREAPGG